MSGNLDKECFTFLKPQTAPSICMRKLILIFLVLGLAFSSNGQDRTSENNERLKGWLKKFPEADKNKDGVLTGAEALEFSLATELH